MNNSKRQQQQTERALAKKEEVQGEVMVPMRAQPQYPVPDDVRELRDSMTADWCLDRDIEILRMYIALETKKGGQAAVVAQLTKAVESLIRTNVSTALRTGEWLSRKSAREFALGVVDEVARLIKPYIHDADEYSDFILELRSRLVSCSSREAVAAANERNENL